MPRPKTRIALPLLLASAALAIYFFSSKSREADRPSDSAPGRTARQLWFGDYVVTGRSVTIAAPPAQLFAMWRDASQLPRFMRKVRSVAEGEDGIWRWVIGGPADTEVHLKTWIVEEREGEFLAWRSVEGSQIEAEGKVMFHDAPGGRGSVVEAIIAYQPPGGTIGHWIAKAFGADPAAHGRHDLKRLKMLVETGEIATAANHRGEGA
jgi:uncharacterized membrane protein